MGVRLSGIAGAAAVAVLVTGCGGGVDLADGTYTYVVSEAGPHQGATVLVQDGAVTDVWASEPGETPLSPARVMQVNSEATVNGDTTTVCTRENPEFEQCNSFDDVRAMSGPDAKRMASWSGLPDGTYALHWETPWWDTSGTDALTITNGVADVTPKNENIDRRATDEWLTAHGSWVRYWDEGKSAPSAICYDNPNGADEEACYTWTAVDG